MLLIAEQSMSITDTCGIRGNVGCSTVYAEPFIWEKEGMGIPFWSMVCRVSRTFLFPELVSSSSFHRRKKERSCYHGFNGKGEKVTTAVLEEGLIAPFHHLKITLKNYFPWGPIQEAVSKLWIDSRVNNRPKGYVVTIINCRYVDSVL